MLYPPLCTGMFLIQNYLLLPSKSHPPALQPHPNRPLSRALPTTLLQGCHWACTGWAQPGQHFGEQLGKRTAPRLPCPAPARTEPASSARFPREGSDPFGGRDRRSKPPAKRSGAAAAGQGQPRSVAAIQRPWDGVRTPPLLPLPRTHYRSLPGLSP